MTLATVVCAAGYGAVAGALLPRAVYRLSVGAGEPRRGACPRGHALTGPAGGWLGPARCGGHGGCGADAASPYGPRAGAFAGLSGAICLSLALCVGPRPELAVWLLAAPVGLVLAAVDFRVRRLPDVLTLPLAAAVLALLAPVAALPGADGSWVRALLGGVVLGCGYGLLFAIHPRGLGFGDVKLALALGCVLGWYGWDVLFTGALLGSLSGAAYGTVLLVRRRAGRKTQVPFGPFMLLGTLGGVLLGGLAV